MSRGPHATTAQRQAVATCVLKGCNAAQVRRELEYWGLLDDPNPRLSQRTIDRMVEDARRRDTASPPWSFLAADPDQARRVLPVALWMAYWSEGRMWLSKDRAVWVAKIVEFAPDIPEHWALVLAFGYQVVSQQPEPDSRVLDMTLGTQPWINPEQKRVWADALEKCGAQMGLQKLDPWIRDTLVGVAKLSEPERAWYDVPGEGAATMPAGAILHPPATYPPGLPPHSD